MADLATVLRDMVEEEYFVDLAMNRLAQFGTTRRQYLGATLLPERPVEDNAFREQSIRYRTVIANDGTRYSPSQKKSTGEIVGEFLVDLGHQDIAAEFTARDYDALIRLLDRDETMDGMARITDWVDTSINLALVEKIEVARWQALLDAKVVRVGDNGYKEDVLYPNPSGHRLNVAGDWNLDTYDPWDDLTAVADMMSDKGYDVNRIITSRKVLSLLLRNPNVARRSGRLIIEGGVPMTVSGRITLADLNEALQADGLPPIETYSLRYYTQTATFPFMKQNTMLFVATTGRDETVDQGDDSRFVPDTLGYVALGRAAGQSSPGRVIRVESFTNKPPRIEAEGWQASLPVITDPEALAVLTFPYVS